MIQTLDKRRSFAHLAIIAAVSTLVACGEPNISAEEASPYVDGWATSVEGTLREMAVAPAGKKTFQDRLRKAAAEVKSKVQRDEPPYDVFVDDTYKRLDYQFKLVERTGLNQRGQAVWQALASVDDHALDAEGYALDEIEASLGDLNDANARFEKLETFETNDVEKKAALTWLTAQPLSTFELTQANYPTLTQTVLDSDSGQRMKDRLAEYETVSTEIASLEAKIEHLLIRGFARYARQMKYFRIHEIFVHPKNFDRWTNPNIEGRRPDKAEAIWHARSAWRSAAEITRKVAEKKEVEILHRLMRDSLEQALTGAVDRALADLRPSQPQYDGLQTEYVRYKKIVADGGWEKVPVTRGLRPGREHEVVGKLKKRLQIEGFYPADAAVDNKYDDTLEAAVKAYQETHQMGVTGKPHHMFWASVNIPAKRRMEQIALNMQRWRESNIRHDDPMYVYVNIPDFHAEVWKKQDRKMRFRIVVGNNDLAPKQKREEARKNPDKSFKKHPNRTPTLSAYIDRVIYNPYWNVTDRIRDEEILPEVRASVEAGYKAKIKRLIGVSAPQEAAEPTEDATLTGRIDSSSRTADASEAAAGQKDEQSEKRAMMVGSDMFAKLGQQTGAVKAAPAKPTRSAESYWSTTGDGRVKFDVAGLKKLIGGGSPGTETAGDASGEGAPSGLAAKFPYVDPDTGLVDVSSTHPNAIPGWYEANNYEVMFPGKKWEYVRMKQGDENALGKVKVIFPNLHDVYLHDTPHKALFSRDIRAFSHGCMRMHEPLTFAEYLLEQDGKLDEYNIKQILREGTYEPIFLDRQIPVHIDYVTVRVDDHGRANFLADIYDYDKFKEEG